MVANVLVAYALFNAGWNEARRHLYPHSNISPGYVPKPEVVSYCMNLPPFVARNLVGNLIVRRSAVTSAIWDRWFHSDYFREGANYYVLVFLFWWWIGWRIDIRGRPPRRSRAIDTSSYLLGLFLALALLYVGIDTFRDLPSLRFAGGPAMPVCALIWGVGLLYYFGIHLVPQETRAEHGSRPSAC
jgi:hypothetical protein